MLLILYFSLYVRPFAQCEANGDFQNLPYLVYWFEPSLGSKTPYITLESWDSVLPCSAGERLDYDRVPKEIEKKIRAKQELTAGEQLICDALAAFEAARDRRLPPCTMKRDEELYMVVKIGKNPGDSDSTGNHGTVDKKKDHSKLSSGIKTPKQLGVSSAEKQIPKNGSNKRDEPPKINHQVMPALKAKQAPPGTKSEISAAPVDLIPRKTSVKKRKAKDSNSPKKKQRKFPPYRLSIELQAIVGTDILPRPQVVSELNKYVKANNLQNPLDGREILCDTKLKRFTKKAKVTFFSMQKSISEHLLEKLDRSAYWHENASEAEGNGN